uniref:BED-type domain-containing protein n=1 Tax=Leersia perrieri TaxID=77586 RepID=A0A0D9Y0U2_9ORYZ
MYAIRDICRSKDGARYSGMKEVQEILGKETGRFMVCYSLLSVTPAITDKTQGRWLQQGKIHVQPSPVPMQISPFFLSDQRPTKKHKLPSNVWKYFAKIKTNDDKHKLVYAACNCCNKILKADSQKDGTKHLWDHVATCRRKHPQQYSSLELCQSMGTWDGQCISNHVIIPSNQACSNFGPMSPGFFLTGLVPNLLLNLH